MKTRGGIIKIEKVTRNQLKELGTVYLLYFGFVLVFYLLFLVIVFYPNRFFMVENANEFIIREGMINPQQYVVESVDITGELHLAAIRAAIYALEDLVFLFVVGFPVFIVGLIAIFSKKVFPSYLPRSKKKSVIFYPYPHFSFYFGLSQHTWVG